MSTPDLVTASRDIDRHVQDYAKAAHYYSGDDSSKFLNDIFNDFLKAQDFDGTLNYASIPVDAVADRLQLLSIKGPTDDITAKIAELWDANKIRQRPIVGWRRA